MTAKELAKKLGISESSISIALNNKTGIGDVTRRKIIQAALENGMPYHAEEKETMVMELKSLQLLIYRKNGSRADKTPYFSQIFSDVMEGADRQASRRGYKIEISYLDPDNLCSEIRKIERSDKKGILLLATEMTEEQISLFHDVKIPIVMLDNYMDNPGMDCVLINNEQGLYEAVSFLYKMGHQDIGYLHVDGDANNFVERYFGFLKAVRKNNMIVRDEAVVSFTSLGGEDVYPNLKKELLKRKKMPTAFVADNDIIAIQAIRILKEMGFDIPRDISIVGFDDIIFSEMAEPALTTIHTSKHEIGSMAVNMLIDRMKGRVHKDIKIEIATRLVVRKSVYKLK